MKVLLCCEEEESKISTFHGAGWQGVPLSQAHLVWKAVLSDAQSVGDLRPFQNLLSRPDTNSVPSSVGWWLWAQLQLHGPLL